MDPTFQSPPERNGVESIRDSRVSLYYELRGIGNANKILMLNGAFATLKHYDYIAHFLSQRGLEVLTFDYRGIGKSKINHGGAGNPVEPRSQTSDLLADDALDLVNAVWGTDAKFHVYGASMGGFIAQSLALKLVPEKRLLSLFLAVTARGQSPRMPFLGAGFYKVLMPLMVKKKPEDMVRSLLPQCFEKAYLDSTVTTSDGKTTTNRELWQKKWTDEYTQWYSFADTEACACQCTIVGKHWLTDEQAASIKTANIPIYCHIALDDKLMKPKDQQVLSTLVGGQKKEVKGGHMGSPEQLNAFCDEVVRFFESASAAQLSTA